MTFIFIRRGVTALGAIMLSFSLLSPPLAAFSEDPAADCNQNDDIDRQIEGCTQFIQSGKGLGGNLAIAYMNRGIANGSKRRFTRALADFTESIKLDPEQSVTYYNRGNVYFDMRRYANAIADYTAAIDLDPDFALAYFNRGIAYENVGKRDKSRDDYTMVLQIDPLSEAAKAHLSRLDQVKGGKVRR